MSYLINVGPDGQLTVDVQGKIVPVVLIADNDGHVQWNLAHTDDDES